MKQKYKYVYNVAFSNEEEKAIKLLNKFKSIVHIKDVVFCITDKKTNLKTKKILKNFCKNKKNFKFLNIKYGDILIFSPLILHGNTINKTKETRFSLNCRFKSLLSPYDVFSKTHRNIPHFYRPLQIKAMTKIGFNFINGVKINNYKINKKFK